MYWPSGTPDVYVSRRGDEIEQQEESEEGIDLAHSHPESSNDEKPRYVGLECSADGLLFFLISKRRLEVWHACPILHVSTAVRSARSMSTYGDNVEIIVKQDASVVVVRTANGYLMTYGVNTDTQARVHQLQDVEETASQFARRNDIDLLRVGVPEVTLRFRIVIKIDAGIKKALALEDGVMVATENPPAMQLIEWAPREAGTQTKTAVLSQLPWFESRAVVVEMVHDRAMGLSVWITQIGSAYAVQTARPKPPTSPSQSKPGQLEFDGHCVHSAETEDLCAIQAAINARFSLIAIACVSGEVHVYSARDYSGSLPKSHVISPATSSLSRGPIVSLAYSYDGYALFVGYKNAWGIWSAYGHPLGNSFESNRDLAISQKQGWLSDISFAKWLRSGNEIAMLSGSDNYLYIMALNRNSMATLHAPANSAQLLVRARAGLSLWVGNRTQELSSALRFWRGIPFPTLYFYNHQPIRMITPSLDGRYVAISGRRGLAHYSVQSNRWKSYEEPAAENEFAVRGGMCWFQHVLIAAVDSMRGHEIRLYSREQDLSANSAVFVEKLSAPVVCMSVSGEDSLLVYTNDNNLRHYLVRITEKSFRIIQMGKIGLYGIIRSPARVRSVSWYIPDYQMIDGDPAQDVMHAAVLFLVDAKLVLLRPATDEKGQIRYDMKVLANGIEWFLFARDMPPLLMGKDQDEESGPHKDKSDESVPRTILAKSMWMFDGHKMQCWPSIEDILQALNAEEKAEIPAPVSIPVDFYPTGVVLSKGIIQGVEANLSQRQDIALSSFNHSIRTHLFISPLLRYYLERDEASAALDLVHSYDHLTYLPHSLEILLHEVLDDEVENGVLNGRSLLQSVLAFLSSVPEYLDIVVQCARKSEVQSWQTLFKYLPPARELYQESLRRNMLSTACSYLIVLHTMEETEISIIEQCRQLLSLSIENGNEKMGKELLDFLLALDNSGDTLRQVMADAGLPVVSKSRQSSTHTIAPVSLPSRPKELSRNSSAVSS